MRSNLSSHLHSFTHSSHFLEGYTILLHSLFTCFPPPLLVLPSSFFLLLSSKFSHAIPSPRTPLISPLPACFRSPDKRKRRKRTDKRGMAGQKERGRRREEREAGREREKGLKKFGVRGRVRPLYSGLRRKDTGFPRDHIFLKHRKTKEQLFSAART